MIPCYNPYYFCRPFLPPTYDMPPTLYSVLNSIINGTKEPEDYTKIKDLAKEGCSIIFDFDFPLSSNIVKEDFETMILNHYIMRRIGFETVTAFKIALDCKLNEIMPIYNKMLDSLENWNIFNDGEKTIRKGYDNRTTENTNNTTNNVTNNSTTQNTSDRRFSELPQNEITNVQDGNYMTQYNLDSNNALDTSNSVGTAESNTNGTDNKTYEETIEKTNSNKIEIMKEMQENIKSIYTLIYKELDCLFYGLV